MGAVDAVGNCAEACASGGDQFIHKNHRRGTWATNLRHYQVTDVEVPTSSLNVHQIRNPIPMAVARQCTRECFESVPSSGLPA